ncbi:hypothetical protein ACS0TY_002924 [Phlomoides rotata]
MYGHGPESRRYNQLILVIGFCKGPLRVSMVASLDFHLMVVGGIQITVMFVFNWVVYDMESPKISTIDMEYLDLTPSSASF